MTARTMLDKLKRVLNARTQRQLGEALGLAEGSVSKMLAQEEEKDMGLKLLKRIADRSGVPIGELAEWWAEEAPHQPPPSGYFRASMRQPLAIDRLWHQKQGDTQ